MKKNEKQLEMYLTTDNTHVATVTENFEEAFIHNKTLFHPDPSPHPPTTLMSHDFS
jgi:hypothetical protein